MLLDVYELNKFYIAWTEIDRWERFLLELAKMNKMYNFVFNNEPSRITLIRVGYIYQAHCFVIVTRGFIFRLL